MATEALSVLLSDLGDSDAAARLLRGVPPVAGDRAARGRYETNLGWFALRAQEASPDPRALPALRARLAEARRAFAPIDPAWTANAATNEAWAALLARDLPAVHAHLAEVARLDPAGQGFGAPYAALVGARLALAEGRLDDAARQFAAVEARARRDVGGGDAELGWRARFGAGRVARTRGDAAAAIGHFTAALAEVERLGLRASVRGDRAVFHADRRALVVETVALLVAEGRVDAAFEVADAARVRPLRALKAGLRVGALDAGRQARWAAEVDAARDAIEAWRAVAAREGLVPLAEEAAWRAELEAKAAARDRALDGAFAWLDAEAPLTVPPGLDGASARALLGEDEALVAFGPGRWAFRVTRGAIAAREVGPGDDLLGPWRDGLGVSPASAAAATAAAATPVGADPAAPVAPIRHVYLVAGDRGAAVFALPTAGPRPLLVDVSVAFLPYAGVLANSVTRAAGAPLVVADPRADLAHAAAEGRAVAAALPGARLLAGSAATLDATLAGLATAPVFHFAGHGVLRPEQPWDAHLRLAGFDRLGLAEVLTHPVAARLVVLSGCETGTDAVLADERVVGLPEAFLAAGAQAVVATDRPVDDAVTRRFVERFYAAGGATAPAAALRVAALALREEGEALWSAFRLVGLR
ncbi:MAG: CHAT domain-containing protein [Myxococcales bacterium]|nr:CHAT domain-containing protein [Myxococcales bacterium]